MFITVKDQQEIINILEKQTGIWGIYKHSATCPTALFAQQEVEKTLEAYPQTPIVYIHVRDQREMSNRVAEHFVIEHESPQLIIFNQAKIQQVINHYNITEKQLKQIFENSSIT